MERFIEAIEKQIVILENDQQGAEELKEFCNVGKALRSALITHRRLVANLDDYNDERKIYYFDIVTDQISRLEKLNRKYHNPKVRIEILHEIQSWESLAERLFAENYIVEFAGYVNHATGKVEPF